MNPNLPSPRVPPEVTDRILDHLHDTKRILVKCSLVCRAWLPTTRYHIFENIDLWSRAEFDRLYSLVGASKLDTLPKAALYVRNLEILFWRMAYDRVAFINHGFTVADGIGKPNFKDDLLDCLPYLSNVEHLGLYHVDFPHLTLDLRKALTTFSPAIKSIKIKYSLMGGPLFCEEFLKSFPDVRIADIQETVSLVYNTSRSPFDETNLCNDRPSFLVTLEATCRLLE